MISIDPKAKFLFSRLLAKYGQDQLNLLRTCLTSVTLLIKMADLGGCTAQQVLRRKHGIVVRHETQSGKHEAVVMKGPLVILRADDDCLASGSLKLTEKVWNSVMRDSFKYMFSPAFTYLHGKDVLGALDEVDFAEFEKVLLPALKKEQAVKVHLDRYEATKHRKDPAQSYELYDALVRLCVYVRDAGVKIVKEGLEDYTITEACEALTDQSADCVRIGEEGKIYLSALRKIHPTAEDRIVDGELYLVKRKVYASLAAFHGGAHQLPSQLEVDRILKEAKPLEGLKETPVRCAIDASLRTEMKEIVGRVLGNSGNPNTTREIEICNYYKSLVQEKKFGKNSLVGLGLIAGVGPIGACLDRVFQEVRKKLRGTLSDGECMKLAASKLAAMNSAKIISVDSRTGELQLVDRVKVGEPALVQETPE